MSCTVTKQRRPTLDLLRSVSSDVSLSWATENAGRYAWKQGSPAVLEPRNSSPSSADSDGFAPFRYGCPRVSAIRLKSNRSMSKSLSESKAARQRSWHSKSPFGAAPGPAKQPSNEL